MKSKGFWTFTALLCGIPIALGMGAAEAVYLVGLWKRCDLTGAGGGFALNFVGFPLLLGVNLLLLPVLAMIGRMSRKVAVNRVLDGATVRSGARLGLIAGLVFTALALLVSWLVVTGVVMAMIPSDYPTTCGELGRRIPGS
ncbi:hypothetical protein [Saccharopolyspora indica]|uniref:hypothetical protein n=1 Tax=Saccharopolyspora indica TaxID=1229659 RepID=UPI002FE51DCD